MTVVMLESTDRWGGSSAMSGGGLWLPNNPLMSRAGVGDSRDEALTYLEATVGDAGPAASRARKEAFVDGVAGFVNLAERLGVRFARAKDYPDYYPELPGGKIGRAIEVEPFDVHTIGEWWATSRGQDGVPAPMLTDDFWLLSRAWSTPDGMARGAKVVFRVIGSLLRR
jgi:3-oxosteroid 1-dehydrogenase